LRRLVVSVDARIAVAVALAVSLDDFGPAAADRYRTLIQRAYRDLADNPERPGTKAHAELPADIRLYPIRHSNARIAAADRVSRPRHVIAFRYDAERVEIVHVLHERMDLPRRLR